MMRSAPICCALNTPRSPTAPSPTTATVLPGPTAAASAANHPVPSTSEEESREGIISCDGISGVATSVPSASGTRRYGACAPSAPMGRASTHRLWYPALQIGQVLSDAKNDPTTNCPFFTERTALPASSTTPTYSCPIGVGSPDSPTPRYGHRSEPQTQLAERRMIASVGSMILGSGRSSKRTSPGP